MLPDKHDQFGYQRKREASSLSKTYAPFGRLIPCETVITIESSKLDTPVIGLVTEDVWHNGVLVIPAGAEVHGRASLDRARERIAVSGKWVVVRRDGGPLKGTELIMNGIALERVREYTTGELGLRDGYAGLVGQLIKTDDWQEIKLFASTFLAGFAGGLQQLQNVGTAFGGVTQVPVVSTRNAAQQGTAEVLNAYARQIQETIARDGFFVRVPAGKQFYLYVTETIDQAKEYSWEPRKRGNLEEAAMRILNLILLAALVLYAGCESPKETASVAAPQPTAPVVAPVSGTDLEMENLEKVRVGETLKSYPGRPLRPIPRIRTSCMRRMSCTERRPEPLGT